MITYDEPSGIHGVMASFENADALVAAAGLDPTGVAVPEAGWLAGGGTAYLGALAAYASGISSSGTVRSAQRNDPPQLFHAIFCS